MKHQIPQWSTSLTFRTILVVLIAVGALPGCAGTRKKDPSLVRIKGSDTMLVLSQRWSEKFMALHPGVSIYAEGGGTATGIKSLINNNADICAASRLLRPDEVSALAKAHKTLGISYLVAKDALSIYLHPANSVKDLTLKQLRDIFSGRITNWAEVGGSDANIEVFIRSPNSGTYLYFKERVLEGNAYSSTAVSRPTTEAVVNSILNAPNGIGYGGIAHGNNLTHSKVNGISPSEESVRYDLYPITRYLYLYTINKPGGITKRFIDWILSTDGQRIVKRVGYIPLWRLGESSE